MTDKLGKEIRKGGAGVILVRGVTGFLVLVSTVFLTRVLGASEYGRYSYAMSIVALITTFSQFGLPTLVIRETARATKIEDWELTKGLWRWSQRNSFILTIVLGALVATAYYVSLSLEEGVGGAFPFIALLIPPILVLLNLQVAILRGLRLVASAPFFQKTCVALALTLGAVAAFYGFKSAKIEAEFALLLELTGLGVGLILARVYFLTNGVKKTRKTDRLALDRRYWISAAVPLALVVGLRMINTNIDILSLGFFRPPADVGVYKIAAKVATIALLGQEVVNMVITPHFARLHAQTETAILGRLASRSARISFVVALTMFALAVLFGEQVLELTFGPEFIGAYQALLVLMFAHVLSASVGSVGVLLNMTGYEKKTARGALIATIVNVVLNISLIPIFGLIGAALATAASLIVWNLVLWRYVCKNLGINSGII